MANNSLTVEGLIESAIAQGDSLQEVAQIYGLGLVNAWAVDWGRVNRAILQVWPHQLGWVQAIAREAV